MKKMITKKLEEICLPEKGTIISGPFGSNIGRKYFVEEGIPVIRGNNLSLSLDKFYDKDFVFVTEEKAEELNCYAEKYDLIFTAAGTLGQVGIIPEDSHYDKYVISNKQIRARVDRNKVDVLYAYYWFSSPWIQKLLSLSNKGSAVPLLSLWEVKNLPISFPESLEDQQKIVRVLETISQKIDNNNKINSALEVMAKTIYDYWFLQFEFPNEEGKPYKSSGGKMIWNEELEREIPEGWKVKKIGETFSSSRGISYNSKNLGEKGVPMINLASFKPGGGYKIEGIKRFSGDYDEDRCLKAYDLVMCNTQQTAIDYSKDIIGNAFLIPDIFESDIVSSHHVTTIKVKNENIKYYLCSLFNTKHFHRYIAGFTNGTNILGLLFNGVENYKCEIPDERTLERYSIFCRDIEKRKSQIIKENQELTSLRDFLLPLLMNGQVSFKE